MCRDHYTRVNGARGITGYIEGVIKPEIANTVLFDADAEGRILIEYDEENSQVVLHTPSMLADAAG
jgi:ATP-dependent Clp protease ATP-binding subunit ClpA